MNKIGKSIEDWVGISKESNNISFTKILNQYEEQRSKILLGGGEIAIEKHHSKHKMTAYERVKYLLDSGSEVLDVGQFCAYEMYEEYGEINSGGVVVKIGKVNGVYCVVVANDATVKAGAYFEVSLKKTLRAQQISLENQIPIIYLVDSAGVFLPLQDQVFPDEAHFGRIFYNNAKLSSLGVTQIACVMGPCVAGGAYLPVMCDKYIIVDGGSMFLAGPALVKAAIGQNIDAETLGGSVTHTSISGTADYRAKNDIEGLDIVKDIMSNINLSQSSIDVKEVDSPLFSQNDFLSIFDPNNIGQYDMYEIIARLVDKSEFMDYKGDYGKTIICGNAKIAGHNIGIVANQKLNIKTNSNELQLGGVIYSQSADKAARFVMNCNQDNVPILFLHDVNGFMVGRDSEWGGIAKDGAKLVNAVSNSTVPKISIVIGGSYGAGNYAMSGRAYGSRFLFSWPSAKMAVMGGDQAANTLMQIKLAKMSNVSEEEKQNLYNEIKNNYDKQADPRYGAARMWVDEIIDPRKTREVLIECLSITSLNKIVDSPKYGVLQV